MLMPSGCVKDFPLTIKFTNTIIKINILIEWRLQKWTYHKEWSFASNCFIFFENLFQF